MVKQIIKYQNTINKQRKNSQKEDLSKSEENRKKKSEDIKEKKVGEISSKKQRFLRRKIENLFITSQESNYLDFFFENHRFHGSDWGVFSEFTREIDQFRSFSSMLFSIMEFSGSKFSIKNHFRYLQIVCFSVIQVWDVYKVHKIRLGCPKHTYKYFYNSFVWHQNENKRYLTFLIVNCSQSIGGLLLVPDIRSLVSLYY